MSKNLCATCKRRNKLLGYCEDRDFLGLMEGVDMGDDLEYCENYEPEDDETENDNSDE
jgi:hypothetical protein